MGPPGQGFFYCRQELVDELGPPLAAYFAGEGFELGRANTLGLVGLLAAVRFLMDIGTLTIERRTLHLTELLIADIQQRGYEIVSNRLPKRRSAIVALRVTGDADAALRRLTDANIIVSKHKHVIRVSPHCYNTEEEVARVGEVLGKATRGTQPTRI
jgi:selenocysteine lyase/cysteine desulfurase